MQRTRSHRGALRVLAGAAATALLLSGCSLLDAGGDGDQPGGGSKGSGSSSASDGASAGSSAGASGDGSTPPLAELGTSHAKDLPGDPAESSDYAEYYDQHADWGTCDQGVRDEAAIPGLECASVKVPRAWDDPGAEDVEIAMVRLPATGDPKGTLMTNPGGPGNSGVDFLAENGDYLFNQEVRRNYDLVSFDPRGVSRSEGVRCLDDEQTDEYRADTFDGGTPEGLTKSLDWMEKISDACEKNSGDLLPYLDTYSAARDMDVLRAAVGDDSLNYMGFSYGTYLGSIYADLYPDRVGRFVLDGAMEPSLTADELVAGQAEGFQKATESFAKFCTEREDCPMESSSPKQATSELSDLLDSISDEPLPTTDPDRPLTGALAAAGMQMTLYSNDYWSLGVDALKDAKNGDGTALLALADLSAGRQDDGSYKGNDLFAINAVNCLDRPGVKDLDWQKKESKRLLKEYPAAGMTDYSQAMCDLWPVKPLREPAPVHAEGSGEIVVVGTTRDPATPYAWSKKLAKELDNASLITFDGDGHTAYGRSGGCVEQAVNAYLIDGTSPQKGLTC
ncbi:alpha/beta hydrolase [Brachybacterium endophyticum]|uniref:Alpha/beta hydrolase n=1 Tax=Brachybacterium endophyticum TaxID=2182385 RepID=A0A2U2RL60_9MICO|nr:alpha/beta hydrolase [Brachybacterium endophyticum]PWH06612.1 alpha/beta hydrolase [Brachybacterium endophyticum]